MLQYTLNYDWVFRGNDTSDETNISNMDKYFHMCHHDALPLI